MRLALLLVVMVLAGCRATDPQPSEPWSPYSPTGPAALQITQGPPPSYYQTDNVDSNTSLRNRR